MAKTTTKSSGRGIQRQGRRVVPALRRRSARTAVKAIGARPTLGDLIAAAFDTVGESKQVARLLASDDLACAIQKRIVLV